MVEKVARVAAAGVGVVVPDDGANRVSAANADDSRIRASSNRSFIISGMFMARICVIELLVGMDADDGLVEPEFEGARTAAVVSIDTGAGAAAGINIGANEWLVVAMLKLDGADAGFEAAAAAAAEIANANPPSTMSVCGADCDRIGAGMDSDGGVGVGGIGMDSDGVGAGGIGMDSDNGRVGAGGIGMVRAAGGVTGMPFCSRNARVDAVACDVCAAA